MNTSFDSKEAFDDPVGWLARFGIAAQIVDESHPLPEAA